MAVNPNIGLAVAGSARPVLLPLTTNQLGSEVSSLETKIFCAWVLILDGCFFGEWLHLAD